MQDLHLGEVARVDDVLGVGRQQRCNYFHRLS
jgi:hypothetical protein